MQNRNSIVILIIMNRRIQDYNVKQQVWGKAFLNPVSLI